jgi:RNA polymerase sigma-54 factor
VQKVGEDYVVSMNKEHLPHVRISKHYRQLIESPDTPEETKSYIREKIRAGVFMIKSIEQRQQTIRNIAMEIVAVQRDFFEHGVSHLRPLVMSAISEKLGVHETTVSRAIAGKYVQTPRGVFELKYFFNPGYRTEGGESVSNKTIKDLIQQLVDEEDLNVPLSDQAITDQLKARGLKVARRTIAKYREELKILPSHLRR